MSMSARISRGGICMGNAMTLPMTASLATGSLEAYIQSVNRFPVL